MRHAITYAMVLRGVVVQRRYSLAATAVLGTLLSPDGVDQDPSHRLGRGSEKMTATVPLLVSGTDQPDVRLVHQGRFPSCPWDRGIVAVVTLP